MDSVSLEAPCSNQKHPKLKGISGLSDDVKAMAASCVELLRNPSAFRLLALIFIACTVSAVTKLPAANASTKNVALNIASQTHPSSAEAIRIEVKTRGQHGEILNVQVVNMPQSRLERSPVTIGGLQFRIQTSPSQDGAPASYQIRIRKKEDSKTESFYHMQHSALVTLFGKRPGILSEIHISRIGSSLKQPLQENPGQSPTRTEPRVWRKIPVKQTESLSSPLGLTQI